MARLKPSFAGLFMAAALTLGGAAIYMVAPNGVTPVAQAQSASSVVDDAKSKGRIGEQADGYLGAVVALSASEQAAMDEINIKRKEVYTRLAREKGVSINDVAQLTAEKLVAKAPRGQMIKDGFGQWVKK